MRLNEIVRSYIMNYRVDARAEMRYFQAQPNLRAVINKASLCEMASGKRQ